MYLNILKKDLRSKKTMNMILLVFIILATMFVASGLNNVFTVMNGTDYYLDKAEIGDFVVITMGNESTGYADGILDKADCVNGYKIETCIFGSQDSVSHLDGAEVETKNTALFQSISDAKLKFFDTANKSVSAVNQGEVLIAGKFIENNGFKVGDYIRIKLGDVEKELKIAGKVKDAFLGSDFMGNTRFLLNQADYDTFLADEMINAHYLGEVIYIETDDVKATTSAIADIPGIAFTGARDTLKMCYVMEMIVAFIILILSVCLIIVSFVVLRFSIGFTIAEEYREIGVMKAIGIKNHKIRGLYIVKYLMMSVIGGIIGFFASIPFGNMLIMSVSENMVLGNDAGFLINIISTVGTVIIILLFAYGCTSKVKKLTPIDAIRSGQTGERFGKKSFLRIGKTSLKPSVYMALNDVLSAPKRFMTIIISFFLCTLFVLMLVNMVATMKSPNLITTFGTESNLYIPDLSDNYFYCNNYFSISHFALHKKNQVLRHSQYRIRKETVMNILEVKDLCKTYIVNKRQNNVLKNVSFTVEEGEMVAVMGPSGSGKSTLLYAVSGMDGITAGEVLFCGRNIAKMGERELADLRLDEMGFIFQQMYMLKNLTVLDNIILPAVQSNKNTETRKEIVRRGQDLMRKLGIIEIADNDINEVSGGQLQRACICRSMINNPKMIFADEPTGALNRTSSDEVMEELTKLNADGTTVMLVTHDVKVAAKCTRVMYIVDGNIRDEYNLGRCESNSQVRERERALNNRLLELGW